MKLIKQGDNFFNVEQITAILKIDQNVYAVHLSDGRAFQVRDGDIENLLDACGGVGFNFIPVHSSEAEDHKPVSSGSSVIK